MQNLFLESNDQMRNIQLLSCVFTMYFQLKIFFLKYFVYYLICVDVVYNCHVLNEEKYILTVCVQLLHIDEMCTFFTRPDLCCAKWRQKHHLGGSRNPPIFFLMKREREYHISYSLVFKQGACK